LVLAASPTQRPEIKSVFWFFLAKKNCSPVTVLHTLLSRHLRDDDADPTWPDRDRLLAAAPDASVPHATIVQGPPGLALGAATGMAMAERALAARFGRSLVDHRTWFAARPIDLVSGAAQEAALVAGTLMLDRLAVLVALTEPDRGLVARFHAAGWNTRLVPAGDGRAANGALAAAARSQKPTLIAEHGSAHAAPGDADIDAAPMEGSGRHSASARRAWLKRLRRHASRDAFQHAQSGFLPPGWHKPAHAADTPEPEPHSTAAAIRQAMARLAATLPDLAPFPPRDGSVREGPRDGFSRDASGREPSGREPSGREPSGREPSGREPSGREGPTRALPWDALTQAASSITLGMALHGGLLPVGWFDSPPGAGPDAALSEARRLGARMLHIVSANGNAAPAFGVPCFRPADGAEARDCLILALRHAEGPTTLAISPDPAPVLPADATRLCARGAYLLRAPAPRDITLIASGPDVAHALALAGQLERQGLRAAIVSMPSRALFDAQDELYRTTVLGQAPRIVFAAQDPASFIGLAGPADFAAGPNWERLSDTVPRTLKRPKP
jgi:transketolase